MILSEDQHSSLVSVPLVAAHLWLISRVQDQELILTVLTCFFNHVYGGAEFGVFSFAFLADTITTFYV